MAEHNRKTDDADNAKKGKVAADVPDGAGGGDDCRCKEASKMTPRQLLGLMLDDLTFWNKEKKR